MDLKIDVDVKKLIKAYQLVERELQWAHRRAVQKTARNIRVQVSKGDLGLTGLRRKKVPRARVKEGKRKSGGSVWIGLNDIRLSEFKGKLTQTPNGVQSDQGFFGGHFIGTFPPDKRKRALIMKDGNIQEAMVPIEKKAQVFLSGKIAAQINPRFESNLDQAINELIYVKRNR